MQKIPYLRIILNCFKNPSTIKTSILRQDNIHKLRILAVRNMGIAHTT